jgi:hypothetical protein
MPERGSPGRLAEPRRLLDLVDDETSNWQINPPRSDKRLDEPAVAIGVAVRPRK